MGDNIFTFTAVHLALLVVMLVTLIAEWFETELASPRGASDSWLASTLSTKRVLSSGTKSARITNTDIV